MRMKDIAVGKCYRGGTWGAVRRVEAMDGCGDLLEWYGERKDLLGHRYISRSEGPIDVKTFARWAKEEYRSPKCFGLARYNSRLPPTTRAIGRCPEKTAADCFSGGERGSEIGGTMGKAHGATPAGNEGSYEGR